MFFEEVREADPEIYELMKKELHRQQDHLELIASENFVSKAVLSAMGSHLTNKYAEGTPGHRFYGGCVHVDVIEQVAIDRVKALFGAEYANVQPHSGAQANSAVYMGILEPEDTVLGMRLDQGGHLTHGSPANLSGKFYNFISYGVDKVTETIDYDEIEELIAKHHPKLVVVGASSYPRAIDFERISRMTKAAGCYLMVDMAHIAGLVAAGQHQSPVPYADFVTTTTHKTLRGPRGGVILCKEKYGKLIDKGVFPGTQGGPLEHMIAAKAIAFKEAATPEFKAYQEQVVKNAKVLCKALEKRGFRIVSGGTDNHLMLLDVSKVGLTGKEADDTLGRVNITANKNAIPYDKQSPFVTSGIRVGTPAITTRGMVEEDMEIVAEAIEAALIKKDPVLALEKVAYLTEKYPLYPGLMG